MVSRLHSEGKAIVHLKPQVFINPAQIYNRNMSILAISTFGNIYQREHEANRRTTEEYRGLRIFEGLAASGIRAIRYVKEIQARLDFV
jgi:tRNA (guanine26-N2/guanine27-N2)-dimethyltransferase